LPLLSVVNVITCINSILVTSDTGCAPRDTRLAYSIVNVPTVLPLRPLSANAGRIRSARAGWLGCLTPYGYFTTLRANVNTIQREYLYSFAVPARRYCAGWLVRSHCAPQLRHAIPERRRVGELIRGATRSDRIAENWGKLATHATQKRHPVCS